MMKKLMIAVAATLTLGATPALAQTKPVLGPNGFGGLKLGMSLKQARATGSVTKKIDGGADGCSGWDLKKYPTGKNAVGLYISPKVGVAAFFAPKAAKTPEGVAIGTAKSQLDKAYPHIKQDMHGLWVTTVPGNNKAYYSFTVLHGKVTEYGIALKKQDCFN
ncbi:hypothetical protein ACIBI9_19880 [Nonomuraea sp. NPDC050451]|uniref:hypothetical protein n=1 Tax=Nonomuraea sp. NPDC050451 TaxID=3364364 RepID=UPI0037AA30FD